MRILLVQTQAENAGAQEVSRLLAAGLGAGGFETHQVFFFRRTGAFDDALHVSFCADARPKGPLGVLRMLMRLVACVRRLKPDAVLTFQHYGNVVAAPVARLLGVPVVIASQTTSPVLIPRAARFLDRLFGAIGTYDAVVANSDATENDYASHPASYRRRLVRIAHGFESKTSTLDKQAARRAFGLPQDGVLIGSVARLHPLKHLDAAIALLPLRPAWHLALAGQGAERGRLESLAAGLGCRDRLHFVGELPSKQVGTFLAGLDAFVFPSLAETFGLAAVEAAQAGVPVVANRLPVLEEVLRVDGKPCALFAAAADAPAFAAAVDRVLSDRPFADELIGRARRLSQIYSLDAMVQDYAAWIDVLRARKRGTKGKAP